MLSIVMANVVDPSTAFFVAETTASIDHHFPYSYSTQKAINSTLER